jgi:hypothetical protein
VGCGIPYTIMEYCCEPFKKAIETYNITYHDEINKYQIEGYDMDGSYPSCNYCPNCGAKL